MTLFANPPSHEKAMAIFKAAEALSLSCLEVTNAAVRISARIPVDHMDLGAKFVTLNANTIALAELLGFREAPKPKGNPIETQGAEFDAAADLMTALKALPAIVDDDYPAQRSKYEGALHRFILALKNNGRIK